MTSRVLAGAAALAIVLASAGCGPADVRAGEAIVRDSAGIAIVENERPLWRAGQEWSLSERPVLSIGMIEGPPEYQLDRVNGSRRLADGRIAVANAGSSEVRFFDAEGRFLRSAGRAGEGPGEFRGMGAMLRGAVGDSLFISDFGARRVTIIGPDGSFVRSARMDEFAFPLGRFADGRYLGQLGMMFRSGEVTSGSSRDSMTVITSDLENGGRDTLMTVIGMESVRLARGNSFTVSSRPFGRSTVFGVTADGFYMGTQDAFEIGRYAPDGTLLSVIRRRWEPIPVTPADIADYQRRERANISGPMREMREELLDRAVYPATHGPYGQLIVDRSGNLWVMERRGLQADSAVHWSVFDDDGVWLGSVRTPANFAVHDIGDDYVLGRRRDELEVEYVQMYRLEKPR